MHKNGPEQSPASAETGVPLRAADTAEVPLYLRTDTLFAQVTALVKDESEESSINVARQPLPASSRRARIGLILLLPWLLVKRLAVLARYTAQLWIRHHPGLVSRVLETLLWPALLVALSWYSRPANPFYINEGFPWPWLGPWLIGLRYGVSYGTAASVGLLAAWALLTPAAEFPRLYFLGGAIATLVAGEFGSYWRMQTLRLQESLHYLNDKVERLTRRLYLVKLSHDELEYEMVDRPGTLRESLIALRTLMDQVTQHTSVSITELPGAQQLLEFVMAQCRIESAAIYAVRMDPVVQLKRIASAGGMLDPSPDDPMIGRALETGHQVHLQDALLEVSERKQLIAVTPLMSSTGQPFGFLAIGSMPFTALTTDNLQTIAVLLESYADYLRLSLNASELIPQWPEAPNGLAGEFGWLSRLRQEFGLASRCVVWRIRHVREDQMLEQLQQLHSRGETAWRWPPKAGLPQQRSPPCVIALVPFAEAAGVSIYKQRIFDSMDRKFGDLGIEQLHAFDFALGRENGFARLRWLAEGSINEGAQ